MVVVLKTNGDVKISRFDNIKQKHQKRKLSIADSRGDFGYTGGK